MADSIIGAGVQGALRGAASGGGMVSTPFKAVQAGGNAIKGVARNISNFHDKQNKKKLAGELKRAKFKKKQEMANKIKLRNEQKAKVAAQVANQKQLNGANKVAQKFASNVKVAPQGPQKFNPAQPINAYNKNKQKIAKGLAKPVAKPSFEDKIKKALGMKN